MKLFAFALLLAGCGGGQLAEVDGCAHVTGTCLSLQLNGVADIDSLQVNVVDNAGGPDKDIDLSTGATHALPLALGVQLPDAGGNFSVAVGALKAGSIVASGRTSIAVAPAGHLTHTMELAPFSGPSCSDGLKDGAETSIDCGGTCPGCRAGQRCILDADCASPLHCNGNPRVCG